MSKIKLAGKPYIQFIFEPKLSPLVTEKCVRKNHLRSVVVFKKIITKSYRVIVDYSSSNSDFFFVLVKRLH